ncbi:hypothetical protein ABZ801_02575 [Actinomadura sp. NPDC047616]|uniref:hypothetical protein n=1 Tax=Actinomadura sp. NPDC047616 TaxID=3155914 RepID=UPI0033DDFBF1
MVAPGAAVNVWHCTSRVPFYRATACVFYPDIVHLRAMCVGRAPMMSGPAAPAGR